MQDAWFLNLLFGHQTLFKNISNKFWNGVSTEFIKTSGLVLNIFLPVCTIISCKFVFSELMIMKSKYKSPLENTEDYLCMLGTIIQYSKSTHSLCRSKHICFYI